MNFYLIITVGGFLGRLEE